MSALARHISIGMATVRVVARRMGFGYAQQVSSRLLDEMIVLRSDEELELRARGLVEIRDILNGLGIPYCLSGGALLGAIRDGDFIRWDWDVEIDTRTECVHPKREALISELESARFQIIKHDSSKMNFKVKAAKYGSRYEILGYYRMGRMRYRRMSRYPDSLLDGASEVPLRGERYSTFQVPERYLEWMYGEWKTPVRSADIDEYATGSSRTRARDRVRLRIMTLIR